MTINRAATQIMLIVLGCILGGFLIGYNARRVEDAKAATLAARCEASGYVLGSQ